MFEFLAAVQKLTAAREVFNKLPVDSIDIIYRNWHLQVGSHEAIKKKITTDTLSQMHVHIYEQIRK